MAGSATQTSYRYDRASRPAWGHTDDGEGNAREGAGPSLTDEGRRQAEEAGRHLVEWRANLPPFGALYSSPLVRTRETASILGKALDLEVVEKPGLADCNAGEWSGTALTQLARKPEWATVMHYPSGFQFPGGESIVEMHSRVVGTVKELAAAHSGQAVVLASHADPIKAVLADALGLHLDLFQRIMVSPASISAVSYSATGPSVLLTNWTRPPQPGDRAAPSSSTAGRSQR